MPSVVGYLQAVWLAGSPSESQAPISTVCLPEKLIKDKGEAWERQSQPLSPYLVNFFNK